MPSTFVLWAMGVAGFGTCRELGDFQGSPSMGRLARRGQLGVDGSPGRWRVVLPANGSVFRRVATDYGSRDLIRYLMVPALRC